MKQKQLISKDGDSYNLDNPIVKYEIVYNDDKTVIVTAWYESDWMVS